MFLSKVKMKREKNKNNTCGPRDVDDVSWAFFLFGFPRPRRLPVIVPSFCCGCSSSSSLSSFHAQSTPRAVAREAGCAWCAVSSSLSFPFHCHLVPFLCFP